MTVVYTAPNDSRGAVLRSSITKGRLVVDSSAAELHRTAGDKVT